MSMLKIRMNHLKKLMGKKSHQNFKKKFKNIKLVVNGTIDAELFH